MRLGSFRIEALAMMSRTAIQRGLDEVEEVKKEAKTEEAEAKKKGEVRHSRILRCITGVSDSHEYVYPLFPRTYVPLIRYGTADAQYPGAGG